MRNPYSTHYLWPPEVLDAWKSMPLYAGKIAPFTEEFRGKWREWCKTHPKHLWNPVMVEAYKELDRKKHLPTG